VSAIGTLIDKVTRDALSEPLRAAGYKKNGRTFRRSLDDGVQVINVQASVSNAGSSGRFTVNLGVYFATLADLGGIGRLTDNPSESDCHLRCRIGHLLPGRQDLWWEVGEHQDNSSVVGDVRRACTGKGLAWLDAHAKKGGTNGVVLTNTFARSAATPVSANIESMFEESEFLVRGPTSGARVTPVP